MREELAKATICTDSDCCGDTVEEAAIAAGVEVGIRFAMSAIANSIRRELVCCPPDVIDAQHAAMEHKEDPVHFHAICYWSEMSARLAEDLHSLLDAPYECRGFHDGPCITSYRCKRQQHKICDKCHECTVCEVHEICTPM